MKFKAGVRVRGIRCELLTGLLVLDAAYRRNGVEMTVTSVTDGTHSLASLHYAGQAADIRTNDVDDAVVDAIALQARRDLPLDFDLLLEARGTPNEHLHLEYQPKGA